VLLASLLGTAAAFSPSPRSVQSDVITYRTASSFVEMSTTPTPTTDTDVDVREDAPRLVDQPGSAKILRGLLLTDADGNQITLGDKMGPSKSIVIFLRHMG